MAWVIAGVTALAAQVACDGNEYSLSDDEAGINGGFETAERGYPVNWAFFPNPETEAAVEVALDTARVVAGERSLRIAVRPGDCVPGFRSRRMPVEAGGSYRLSGWVRTEGCAVEVNRITQDASGKTNLRRDVIAVVSASSGEWQQVGETLDVAEGEAGLVLIFLIRGAGTVWCDAVRLERVDRAGGQ